jgi:tellurite resistance protein TehA-like permease
MKKDIRKEIEKKNKRLLFLGFFFRYGLCITAIGVPFIFIIIGDILNKKDLFYTIGFIFFPLSIIVMGLDYILACIFEWDHILLVNQSSYHNKMNPNDLDFNDLNKKEFISIGILFFILGVTILVIFLISIIQYYNL